MTTPAPVEQLTATPPPKLVHCICGLCNPDAYTFPLVRPIEALCGHVVSIDSYYWSGVETTCVVCDDLEPTHICPPRETT